MRNLKALLKSQRDECGTAYICKLSRYLEFEVIDAQRDFTISKAMLRVLNIAVE